MNIEVAKATRIKSLHNHVVLFRRDGMSEEQIQKFVERNGFTMQQLNAYDDEE